MGQQARIICEERSFSGATLPLYLVKGKEHGFMFGDRTIQLTSDD